jgi:hypothetical protein
MDPPPPAPPAPPQEEEFFLEQILKLVGDRAHGQATNDQVENAISAAFGGGDQQAAAPPQPLKPKATKKPKPEIKQVPQKEQEPESPDKQEESEEEESEEEETPQSKQSNTNSNIEVDMEDYDDISENDDAKLKATAAFTRSAPRRSTRKRSASSNAPATTANDDNKNSEGEDDDDEKEDESDDQPKKKQAKTTKKKPPKPAKKPKVTPKKKATPKNPKAFQINYDHIPLGQQGCHMMQTFGDGKYPAPATVEAALLGARHKLQNAIQDARCVRRRSAKAFLSARAVMSADTPGKPDLSEKQEWSSEIMYRAMTGHDGLSNSRTKCGFDVEQLQQLFPEEMNAYMVWNEMRSEMEKSKQQEQDEKDEAAAVAAAEANAEAKNPGSKDYVKKKEVEVPAVKDNDKDKDDDEIVVGGHLRARAAHFDKRTNKMKDDWYLAFTEVRRGSFLPAKSKLSVQEKQWDNQKTKNKGRPTGGVWQHMSAVQVRFLHWIGFDPSSALPPPDEETTACLGFLGYDFFGRIIEKAIFLKNLANLKATGGEVDEREVPLDMKEGEQLEASDIKRAMQDPDIKPVPLYGVSQDSDKKQGPQLYFGPGFEDRLEMEMEEYVLEKTLLILLLLSQSSWSAYCILLAFTLTALLRTNQSNLFFFLHFF